MRLVTVAGPPSSGKTSLLLKICAALRAKGKAVGVVKFDCLSSADADSYQRAGLPVAVGLSGNLCPDHFFVSNVADAVDWAGSLNLSMLLIESAGLCNRCAPHIKNIPAVCVVDNLSGVNTPRKIGPMLKLADVVAITKGDVVSQAEREVFAFRVRQVNPRAVVMHVNGLTGQGCGEMAGLLDQDAGDASVRGAKLRFSMPAALCSYCLGERRIGADFQMGNVRKMDFPQAGQPAQPEGAA